MPATPAWPPHSLPRLFVDQALARGRGASTVEGTYLGAVLRLGAGDKVKLFDDRTGEWLAEIAEAGKKRVDARPSASGCATREAVPDLWLLFAPIKRGRIDWLVEKATELGVARLHAGAHPADDRRPAQPRAAARPRDRGGRAMRAHRAARAGRAARSSTRCSRTGRPSARSISPTRAAASRFAPRARPGGDPDRPRRRLHRRGARRDPRLAAGPPGLARPAHPARRHRGAGRGQPVDGGGGGLVAIETRWRLAARAARGAP